MDSDGRAGRGDFYEFRGSLSCKRGMNVFS